MNLSSFELGYEYLRIATQQCFKIFKNIRKIFFYAPGIKTIWIVGLVFIKRSNPGRILLAFWRRRHIFVSCVDGGNYNP